MTLNLHYSFYFDFCNIYQDEMTSPIGLAEQFNQFPLWPLPPLVEKHLGCGVLALLPWSLIQLFTRVRCWSLWEEGSGNLSYISTEWNTFPANKYL